MLQFSQSPPNRKSLTTSSGGLAEPRRLNPAAAASGAAAPATRHGETGELVNGKLVMEGGTTEQGSVTGGSSAGSAPNRKRAADRGDPRDLHKKTKPLNFYFETTAAVDEHEPQAVERPMFNPADVEADPGLRKQIDEYATLGIRDEMRRAYLGKGPCQPFGHGFPRDEEVNGITGRIFRDTWFKEFNWLEYSVNKNAAYCFYCFLFSKPTIKEKFGSEVYTKLGYTNWKKAVENFRTHVGGKNSAHNIAKRNCEAFRNQKQSVTYVVTSHTEKSHIQYQDRLLAVLGVVRFLLRQGLAFRGHDESKNSASKGNFRELLDWLALRCQEVADVINENAPGNHQLTSPNIQKQLVEACSEKVTKVIMNELGDGHFSLLVDESRDASVKEQMAVMIRQPTHNSYLNYSAIMQILTLYSIVLVVYLCRFMNRKGEVVERLLGVKHVKDTTSASLKRSLDKLFATHNLSMSRLRGQGYDGASNMRGELNGLKKLVLDDNPQAFYVHCFAHQLQLVVVAVVKGVLGVSDFFGYAKRIVNMVSASCKRNDDLLQKYHDNLVLQLETGQIFAGRGKHQETSLARLGDTRWGTHHRTLIRFLQMWDSVIEVLQAISEDGGDADERGKASGLIKTMDVFEFVFILHVMLRVLGLTNDLSQALQLKDQNIVSAMNMIESVKSLLQQLRDDGWEPLLEEVTTFCVAKEIPVPDMNDNITARGYARSSRKVVTCLHYYKVQIFNEVIDRNLGEMNHRFSETSTQLLRCVACLDPRESFKSFDRQKLVELASMYPHDFCPKELHLLNDQLLLYIDVMRKSPDFLSCNSLSGLAIKMVETGKHATYAWVYRLITLALILPVATASVERVFSAMNIIKINLRNKMNDGWLNDMMICYVERDIFAQTDDKEIAKHFHGKKNRRGHLPGPPHLVTTT